jgi:WD40 repeat protein
VSPPKDSSTERVVFPPAREPRSEDAARAPALSVAPTAERPTTPASRRDTGEQSTIVLPTDSRQPTLSQAEGDSLDVAPTLGAAAGSFGPGGWFAQPLPVVQRERYSADREIGRGGLGRVTAAQDQRLGREVAIKELFEPYGDRQARFLREALITARLQHPSIVPVYEAGYWPSGAPFYAMKLVSGRTLAEIIEKSGSLAERLAYLSNAIAVVDAIAYAHSQRVLHRDLKPSNIVVGDYGETVVVDWGLAKPLDLPDDDLAAGPYRDASAGLTVAGSILGTPGYMAPEQAGGKDVDERSDIYALGAVLYQLVSGVPPYSTGPAREVLGQMEREDPVPLTEREPETPAELVTVIAKAMARDPEQRYQSARSLAEDLRRFQNGQLVRAHHYSTWALARRWLRRHRALVTVAASLLGVLAGTAAWSVGRIVEERNRAEERAAAALAAQERLQRRTDELTVAQAAHQADPTAALAWLSPLAAAASTWPAAYLVATAARNHGVAHHVWRDHGGDLSDLALSPDGGTLASASRDKTVVLRDLARGTTVRIDDFAGELTDLAFSPAPPYLLATADTGHAVQLWTRAGERARRFDEHQAAVTQVAFSPDGARLATADGAGAVLVRALADPGAAASRLAGHAGPVQHLAFSPDGALLAAAGRDGSVRLWRVARAGAGAERVLNGHTAEIRGLAFSPDGAYLATASRDGTARVWSVPDGRVHAVYEHGAPVLALAFAPAGALLATAASDGAVRRWDLRTGAEQRLGAHDEAAESLAFSPDGALLASGGADGVVRLWHGASGAEVALLTGAPDQIRRLAFARDGARLWSMGRISGVRSWDLGQRTRQRMRGAPGSVNALAVAPGGRYAATGHSYGSVMLWDLATGQGAEVDDHDQSLVSILAFSPDGALLASGSHNGSVRLYDRGQGSARVLGAHQAWVYWLAFSPDGRWLASAGGDGAIEVWNLQTGQVRRLEAGEAIIHHLAFSPRSTHLAAASDEGAIALWDLASGSRRVLGHHDGSARHVDFSPDGAWLASGGADHQLRLWNVQTGASRTYGGHRGTIYELYFAPDGRSVASVAWGDPFVLVSSVHEATQARLLQEGPLGLAWAPDSLHLATVAEDFTVRLWNTTTREGHVLDRLGGAADVVAFSDDGTRLLAGNRNSELLMWHVDLSTEPSALRAWMDDVTTAAIDRDGRLATPAP